MRRQWCKRYGEFTVTATIDGGYVVHTTGESLPIATVRRQSGEHSWSLWLRHRGIFYQQHGSYRTLRDAAKFANDEWEREAS